MPAKVTSVTGASALPLRLKKTSSCGETSTRLAGGGASGAGCGVPGGKTLLL